MTEYKKSRLKYLAELVNDYTICSIVAIKSFFVTLSRMAFIVSLPGLVVFVLGILFYSTFIILGYFIVLAIISPDTAEKIVKEEIVPRIKENFEENIND